MLKKLSFLLFGFLLFASTTNARPLAAEEACPLIDHLIEVNKEWASKTLSEALFFEPITFANDIDRIQKHLELVEGILRKQTMQGLTAEQQKKRLQQMDVLRSYYLQKQFPKNTGHANRQPYFIDQYGTACAVGYLTIQDGQEALAEQIQQENNFAYIREMDYPALLSWASNNGLSEDELAWIQPGYPAEPKNYLPLGNNEGVDGKITKMLVDPSGEYLYLVGNFSAVDGVAANSIIAWDGENWHTLGNGVEGTINDLVFTNDNLYIGGDFTLVDDPSASNFAVWNGAQWEGLQYGDMEGEVLTLYRYSFNQILLGGDFTKVDNQDIAYLVQYNAHQNTWSNDAIHHSVDGHITIPGGMSVDGPVRAFHRPNGGHLLIGGDFTKTAPHATNTALTFDFNHLVYWNGNGWLETIPGPHRSVYAIGSHAGAIFVGSKIDENNMLGSFAVLSLGLWNDMGYQIGPLGDNTIHGFIETEDLFLAYGGFSFAPFVGNFGNGIASFSPDGYGNGYSNFNSTITAVAEFQNRLIFAGDFTEADLQGLPGLAQLALLTSTEPLGKEAPTLTIYSNGQQLNAFHESELLQGQVYVYNMMGQELANFQLQQGSSVTTTNIQLPGGTYAYRLNGKQGMLTGKFVVVSTD